MFVIAKLLLTHSIQVLPLHEDKVLYLLKVLERFGGCTVKLYTVHTQLYPEMLPSDWGEHFFRGGGEKDDD